MITRLYIRTGFAMAIASLLLIVVENNNWCRARLGLHPIGSFSALGRVVVGGIIRDYAKLKNPPDGNDPQAIHTKTHIEIFKTNTLRNRTLERMRVLHPEHHEIPIQLEITNPKDDPILNVTANSANSKYTRVYLDALLDEWLDMRRDTRGRTLGPIMNKIVETILIGEKKVREAARRLDQALERQEPAFVIERLRAEFIDENEDYHSWKQILGFECDGPRHDSIAIMERPTAAIQEEGDYDPIAIAQMHPLLAAICLLIAVPLSLLIPLGEQKPL